MRKGFAGMIPVGWLALVCLTGCGSAGGMRTATPTTGISTNLADYPAGEIAPDLVVREIRPGFFVATHAFPWPHNSLVVETGKSDLVLVDTPYTPDATRALVEWARARFGKRKILAINTGFHYDNLGGNSYLIAEGIPVYGSDAIAGLLSARGDKLRAMTLDWLKDTVDKRFYDAHAALAYVPPDHTFPLEAGLEFRLGGDSLQVYFPGPSHTPDNVVVYFSARKILFGGCMILAGDAVGNTSDADLAAWPVSVTKLSQFDFELLIPGHGDRMDPGLVEHTVQLLG
jgi:metallo-beta-lactamase class B